MQKLLLVSHTHWDREWYLTFEEYRARLVPTYDKLIGILEQIPDYHSFTFDGQTVPVDDYLEIRPEMRGRLGAQVKARKLFVGPLYIIPAGYAPQGETWIRNMSLGLERCAELGAEPSHVYMAEPTSLPEQWPQIMCRFGFDSVVFGRGLRLDPPGGSGDSVHDAEYFWEGPEGSRMLLGHMPSSYTDEGGDRCLLHYCAAAEVFWNRPYDPLREQEYIAKPDDLETVLERIDVMREHLSPLTTSDTLLLMHGCDHLPPQPDTPAFVDAVNQHFESNSIDAHMAHGSLEEYLEDVRTAGNAREVRRGESSGRSDAHSHVWLRRLDADAQNLLTHWMEPAAVFASMWRPEPEPDVRTEGVPDMNCTALRNQAWRYVLQNLAHDTIWGASVDDVYDEVVSRYMKARVLGEDLTGEGFYNAAQGIDTASIKHDDNDVPAVAFNTHGSDIGGVIETELALPPGTSEKHLAVIDDTGAQWPVQVIEAHNAERRIDRFRRYAYVEPVRAVRTLVQAPPVPATGYRTVRATVSTERSASSLSVNGHVMENEHVRITVNADGSFDLEDRRTGRTINDLNRLVDQGDGGSGWSWAGIKRDHYFLASDSPGKLSVIENGPLRATIEARISMHLPVGPTADKQGRLTQTKSCPLVVRVSLCAGSPVVQVDMEIDNRVKNHRLRAEFPTEIQCSTMQCDGAFAVHERAIRITDPTPVKLGKGIGYNPSQPVENGQMHSWLDLSDGENGVALLTRGLPDYEILNNENGTRGVSLTLMRASLGHISIHDPDLTHGCQCPGIQKAEYAVCMHRGNWLEGHVHQLAAAYTSPPRIVQTTWHGGPQPTTAALLDALPDDVQLTALKPSDDGRYTVVRLLNLVRESRNVSVKFNRSPESVHRANLREIPEQSLSVSGDGTVDVSFKPMEIVTLLVTI
jgi:hypothetical protein